MLYFEGVFVRVGHEIVMNSPTFSVNNPKVLKKIDNNFQRSVKNLEQKFERISTISVTKLTAAKYAKLILNHNHSFPHRKSKQSPQTIVDFAHF